MPSDRLLRLVGIVLILVGVVFAVYWFFLRPPPWLFKGAYADYYGEISVLGIPLKLEMRIEIVDIVGSRVKMLTYLKTTSPLGAQETQQTMWTDIGTNTYQMEGFDLKRQYEGDVYVKGLGTRRCLILEYDSRYGNGSITFYIDKTVDWPIKIGFKGGSPQFSMDLDLTDSNIPGLLRPIDYTTPVVVLATTAAIGAILIYLSSRHIARTPHAPSPARPALQVPPMPPRMRTTSAFLVLPNGAQVELVGDALLSRAWIASIFPDAPWLGYISEAHAVMRRRPDGWYIADMGSQYGTYVNGRDIRGAGGEVKLNSGDVVTLGGVFSFAFYEQA